MRKFLIVAEMRALEKQVNLGEISYSLMIEIINEKAEEYATLKLQEYKNEQIKLSLLKTDTIKELDAKCKDQAKEIERLKGENDNNEEHF